MTGGSNTNRYLPSLSGSLLFSAPLWPSAFLQSYFSTMMIEVSNDNAFFNETVTTYQEKLIFVIVQLCDLVLHCCVVPTAFNICDFEYHEKN